ncbi:MAG TPA: isopentenyl-diphosphate Delta-isomerase [Phnomibacter sp.]|nr:isopentenyl-diphosphate Delta-isomerase [Phnomibacter sp.]
MSEVVLVNQYDEPQGTMEKMAAHRSPHLHRAFSIFLFNAHGEMLLQRRAINKYHSGGLWTNACCSHPLPGEEVHDAAHRRLKEELGISTKMEKAFDFIYMAEFDNGLFEHEFDHVFIGEYDGTLAPDPAEVADYCYKTVEEIKADLELRPEAYTQWFKIAIPFLEEHLTARVSSIAV